LRDSAARALARRTEVAAVIKARFDGGLAPRTDYGRAQAALLRQRAALAELEGRAAEARADLAAALQIDDRVVLTDDPPADGAALAPLSQALAEARRRRPELELADARVGAQAQEARAIRGALWPELSLFAQADAQNEALGVTQPSLIGNFSAG